MFIKGKMPGNERIMTMSFKLILVVALAGTAVLFIIQNAAAVELTFLFWTVSMSQAFFMCVVLSTGIILGWWMRRGFGKKKTLSMHGKTL
jgi:lipopolysaccharide assembly protein A